MALILNGTTGITVTDGSNILQDGTVTTDDLAAGAVTSAKMATGAAATNLGNYVQSFNGSTGAVTGVSTFNGATGAVTGVASFNGSTGAVTYTAPVTSVNGQTGAVTVSAGNMSYDTQTAVRPSNFNLGTYLVISWDATVANSLIRMNQQITLRGTSNDDYASTPTWSSAPNYGGNSSYAYSGTWSFKGAISGQAWLNTQTQQDRRVGLVQRIA